MSAVVRRTLSDLIATPILRSHSSVLVSIRTYSRETSHSGAPTGLYGIQHLKNPKGFQRFVDEAIERSTELVTYICGMPSAAEIIRAMDEISDKVCSVVDSAELCRNTHPDREFVEEANKASMRINDYLHVSTLIQTIVCMMR